MSTERRLALLLVTPELLLEALRLPRDVSILGAERTEDGYIELALQGPGFNEVPEGVKPPRIRAEFKSRVHNFVEFVGWIFPKP